MSFLKVSRARVTLFFVVRRVRERVICATDDIFSAVSCATGATRCLNIAITL
jgi:hypothetical protein